MQLVVKSIKGLLHAQSKVVALLVMPCAAAAIEYNEVSQTHPALAAGSIGCAVVLQSVCQEGLELEQNLSVVINDPVRAVKNLKNEFSELIRIPGIAAVLFCSFGEYLIGHESLENLVPDGWAHFGGNALALGYSSLEWTETANIIESILRSIGSAFCGVPKPVSDVHTLAALAEAIHIDQKVSAFSQVLAGMNSMMGSVGYHFIKGLAVYNFFSKESTGMALGITVWCLNLLVSQGLGAKRTAEAIDHFRHGIDGFFCAEDKQAYLSQIFAKTKEQYQDWPTWLITLSIAIPAILVPVGAYSWAITNHHGVLKLFDFIKQQILKHNGGELNGIQSFFLESAFTSVVAGIAFASGLFMHVTREGLLLASKCHEGVSSWVNYRSGYTVLYDAPVIEPSLTIEEVDNGDTVLLSHDTEEGLGGYYNQQQPDVINDYVPLKTKMLG